MLGTKSECGRINHPFLVKSSAVSKFQPTMLAVHHQDFIHHVTSVAFQFLPIVFRVLLI